MRSRGLAPGSILAVCVVTAAMGCDPQALIRNGTGGSGGMGGSSGPGGGGSSGSGGTPGLVDGGSYDAPICADVNVRVDPVIPTVFLLIDQSGSMTAAFGSTTRWIAARDALMHPTTGVVKPLEAEVRFGLGLYTSHRGSDSMSPCPIIQRVAIGLNNHSTMNALYQARSPDAETPTGESIDAIKPDILAVTAPGPKFIVLATDGEPDTCAVPNPQQGQPEAIAAAQSAFQAGIKTFILSVGDEVGRQHQQDMANAGAGLPLDGSMGYARYYQASNPTELADAFRQIIYGTRSCIFRLNGRINPSLAGMGRVTVDNVQRMFQTDWRLNDESTLELLGAVCNIIRSPGSHTVTAVFPCDAIVR